MSIFKRFIHTHNKVYIGDMPNTDLTESHAQIARDNDVPEREICGGGHIDQDRGIVSGESQSFGRYDKEIVEKNLPKRKGGWTFFSL